MSGSRAMAPAEAGTSSEAPRIGVRGLAHSLISLATKPAFDPATPVLRGEPYRAPGRGGVAPRADIYLPPGPGPHPSVVLVHGGGFVIGSRGMKPMRFLATRLLEAGYAVAPFDYRLLLRGARHLDHLVEDVREMLVWWHAQRERFGLDPERISACGLSAGASLLLLASAGQPPVPLNHLVSVFALYDLGGVRGRLPAVLCRLLLRTTSRAEWSRRSPHFQETPAVPVTMLHGGRDALTPASQAQAYLELRQRLGLPTRLHLYPEAPHGFFNDATAPVARQALGDLLAALALHGLGSRASLAHLA